MTAGRDSRDKFQVCTCNRHFFESQSVTTQGNVRRISFVWILIDKSLSCEILYFHFVEMYFVFGVKWF